MPLGRCMSRYVCLLNFLTLSYVAGLHSQILGPAINYTISWAPSLTHVDICVSASSPNFTSSHWIALGFVLSQSLRLDNALIVLGSALSPPQAFYSVASPPGHRLSTLAPASFRPFNLTNINFTVALPFIEMCFARPWVIRWDDDFNINWVSWAVGPSDPLTGQPLAHARDSPSEIELHRCNPIPIDFHFPRELVIGPKIDYKLHWVTHAREVDICVSASSALFTSNSWISLGFTEKGAIHMVGADIVMGSSLGVQSYFVLSNKKQQPFGNPRLNISRTRFEAMLPTLIMCFTRPIESGRYWLSNYQQLAWAVGEVVNGKYLAHGVDAQDATGRTQMHRSINVPEVDFRLAASIVLGPAIKYTLSWKRNGVFLDVCVSASSRSFTEDSWIAVGFASPHTKKMQGADIIIGGRLLPPRVMRSENAWGFPAGNATVSISGASFTVALPSISMCFTLPTKSKLTLGYQQRVIWAVGKVTPTGRILAHWSDAQDSTGATQMHRSANGPRVNFMPDPKAGKDDPVTFYSVAISTSFPFLSLVSILLVLAI